MRRPESSLSQSDQLLRGAWTVLVLAWAVVCVTQAVDRLSDLARGVTYTWDLALADALYWLGPMLALGVGGFLVVAWLSRRARPRFGWRHLFAPAIATVASCFSWCAVLLAVSLFAETP